MSAENGGHSCRSQRNDDNPPLPAALDRPASCTQNHSAFSMVTTVLAAGAAYITPFLSEAALHAISLLLSFAMVGLLFAMMFKWLPDTDIALGDVLLGAIVTAALFEIGELLIGLYIGKLALESTFVLLWVYYNAQIVLAGAEFTRFMPSPMARRNLRSSLRPALALEGE
jgi:uncharacterized BrkB/YihY/UPF0761 family membrane protein